MSIVVVTQYSGIAGQTVFPGITGQTGQEIQAARGELSVRNVTLSTSATTSSFSASATAALFRICCIDANIAYSVGAAPLATTTSTPLASGSAEYIGVSAGDKINVIAI